MADCLYLVRDPRGRVLPESVGATQGHAVCRFATAVAGRNVGRLVAWLLWLNWWRLGYRVVYLPALTLAHSVYQVHHQPRPPRSAESKHHGREPAVDKSAWFRIKTGRLITAAQPSNGAACGHCA